MSLGGFGSSGYNSGFTPGLGSISAYFKALGVRKYEFDEDWALRTAYDAAGMEFDSDPDVRESKLADVRDNDRRRFGIFAKTYEAIRPSSTRATGDSISYSEKPKGFGKKAILAGALSGLALGGFALANYVIGSDNVTDVQTNYIVELHDSNRNGIPDDVEKQRGYNAGERNVTLKYFVQNPDKYKEVVDFALSQTVADYREKNPLNMNIHLVYGGEVPYDATYDNGGIAKFYNSNLPMNEPDNKYSVLGYFLERKGTDRDESGAASGIGVPEFHVFVDGHADFSMSATTKHELGHTMGIDHSHAPFSIMNDNIPRSEQRDFLENEWSVLKDKRLYDFRCFGVPLGECSNLRYVP